MLPINCPILSLLAVEHLVVYWYTLIFAKWTVVLWVLLSSKSRNSFKANLYNTSFLMFVAGCN